MRITNTMVTNTTLMHIQRNMRQLDEVMTQISSTRRIQRPSDNPIIASRALKFRTSVHENLQFQDNIDQGYAWMNVTESTFNNINRELLLELRNLTVQGANQTNNLGNKQSIITQMRSLFEEVKNSVNQTFAGNFLFSGFRTNEPPVFTEDNDRRFIVTQHFSVTDIARERSFQRLPNNYGLVEPVVHDISVLKLAFGELDGPPHIPGFHVVERSINDVDAYTPPHTATIPAGGPELPVLHFIRETGELVMHSDTARTFPREGVSVTYSKTGFRRGDINPKVYFTGREIVNTDNWATGAPPPPVPQMVYNVTQYFSRAAGTRVGDVYQFTLAYMPSFFEGTHPTETALHPQLPPGATIVGNVVSVPANLFLTSSNISVTYSVADPVPLFPAQHIKECLHVQGVELVRALDENGRPRPLHEAEPNHSFNMHNQDIQYEFSTRTFVTVNSLAKNVLTDKMFADFRRFFDFAYALTISDEKELTQHFYGRGYRGEELRQAVEDQLMKEEALARTALFDQFNNMLFLIDRHADNSTREQTSLGARMVRLDLVRNRLDQDEVTYNRLVSENEDTDMFRAMILRFSAEAALHASLRANSGVMQMSLADFIR